LRIDSGDRNQYHTNNENNNLTVPNNLQPPMTQIKSKYFNLPYETLVDDRKDRHYQLSRGLLSWKIRDETMPISPSVFCLLPNEDPFPFGILYPPFFQWFLGAVIHPKHNASVSS